MRRPSRHKGMAENATQSRQVNRFFPESCPMRGNPGGEALTGVGIGQVLSFERSHFRVPTVFLYTEGNTPGNVKARSWAALWSQRP